MEGETYQLFTDGACRGNPGVGGAGAVITTSKGDVIWEGKRYLDRCTNNIAEYQALILGLEGARQIGVRHLEICLDSELLARQINGVYRVKNENLIPLMKAVRGVLSLFESVSVRHVPRAQNRLADKLANQAIDEKDETTC